MKRKEYVSLKEIEKMYEETKDELMVTTWPQVKARVKSQNLRVVYLGCREDGTLFFKCTSGTTPGLWWRQQVQFVDLKKAIDMLNSKLTVRKKKVLEMLINGDIKVWCNDLSWHYYFKYTAWVNGYGLQRETRPSKIRNPRQDHSLCKHLTAVMILLPQIAPRILNDYEKKKVFPTFLERIKNKTRRK